MNEQYVIFGDTLNRTADAIRTRSYTTEEINPLDFPDLIMGIDLTTEEYMRISDLLEYPKALNEDNYTVTEIAKVDALIEHFENLGSTPEPGGYTELNCIIAHGTERINTGIVPNKTTYGIEAKFQLYNGIDYGITNYDWNIVNAGSDSVDSDRYGFGGWNASDDSEGNIQLGPIQGGGGYYDGGVKTDFNQDYIWKYNYNGDQAFYVDNELRYSDLPVGSYQYTHPWNIFTQTFDNSGEAQYDRFFCGKLYYLKIWDGTTLIRDYIPVLDSNNIPCLYDRVNETFNYNEGTGTLEYETLGGDADGE